MASKRILVVDDSPTDQQFLREVLSGSGYQVVCASGAEEAIAKAKTLRPDLILMDVVMPGVNGFQATRQLVQDEATRHIPVIICTTKQQETDRFWGLKQGAKDYITKPVDAADLLAKIAAQGV
jgi:twitching motility two-component system response regulator PilH